MDGCSCCLERVPVVTSGDNSPTSAAHAGLPLPIENHCTSVDRTCEAAEGGNVLIEKRCASVDKTCEATEGGNGLLETKICTCFSKAISLEVKKGLQKCATFPPSSGEAQQEDHSCCHADDGHTVAPAYERLVSLPPTLKLISALKGGREKNGMSSPTENRHVKWAPDVYDPPVTSVCHSVNSSYQRRSKSRKEKNKKEKNKQKKKHKGKSKKNHQNSIQSSSAMDVSDHGSKGISTAGGKSSVDDHEDIIMDYSMGNQEAKCGSSFLRESVAKMHFSIAEAS